MSSQYARFLSESKRMSFKQVSVPDKALLKNLYIFTETHPPITNKNGYRNFKQTITLNITYIYLCVPYQ